MHRIGRLISKYLLTTVVPYYALAWLLLSVVMFMQQASRFSEIFFDINIPAELAWQLTLALLPNVIAFTCPFGILVGTVIGLTKMQGDSELVAIRASGVGNWQIAAPIIVLGMVMSLFCLAVNLKGVPLARALVQRIALETAIKKLESPVEPGTVNTELGGFAIYVGGGDVDTGRWNDIFIQADLPGGRMRLITARQGRIDTSDQNSELVLENAVGWNIPAPGSDASGAVIENLGGFRLAIKTKREELIAQLNRTGLRADELGLDDESRPAETLRPEELREQQIMENRRLLLSATPLILCVLGTFIVLRFTRGGRGFSLAASLVGLIAFYLLMFFGEHLARQGTLPTALGPLVPTAGAGGAIWWMAHSRGGELWGRVANFFKRLFGGLGRVRGKLGRRDLFVDLTTGLRDLDLVANLLKNIGLALGFLLTLFFIFTGLELWKFAATMEGGMSLLLKYAVYRVPYALVYLIPPAAMIGMMATYAIKSRQNELVTWAAAGQSVYRLLLPCFAIMFLIGGFVWAVQETVLPEANRIQHETRRILLDGGKRKAAEKKIWSVGNGRLYSYKPASDNEKAGSPEGRARAIEVQVFELGAAGQGLGSFTRAQFADWEAGRVEISGVQRMTADAGRIVAAEIPTAVIAESFDPFLNMPQRSAHMTTADMRLQLSKATSDSVQRSIEVPLYRRYTTLFLPLVVALFAAPLTVTMLPRGRISGLVAAVGLWLLFIGSITVLEQFGLNGQLGPQTAVWAPLIIFSLIGVFLISRVKT